MALEQYANNATSALGGAISAATTSILVLDASAFPARGQFRILIDSEILLVTAVSGNTFTVQRGVEGTVATTHLNNATVEHVLTRVALFNTLAHDVRSYGAVGDGTTNDSAAVESAITAAAGGGKVVFPPGDYLLGGVALQSDVTLEFLPGANVIVASGQSALEAGGSIGAAWTLDNITNGLSQVTVDAAGPFAAGDLLYIEGTPITGALASPILGVGLNGPVPLMREAAAVRTDGADQIVYTAGSHYLNQSSCTAKKVTPVENVVIRGATVSAQDSTSRSFVYGSFARNIVIEDCTFDTVGVANYGAVTWSQSYDCTVRRCRFDNSPYAAVFGSYSTRLRVQDCEVDAGTAPYTFMLRFYRCADCEVADNFCHRERFVPDTAGTNIDGIIFDTDSDVPANSGNRILRNTVINGGAGTTAGNGRGGIMVLIGTYNTVEGNTVEGGDFGIYMSTYPYFNRVVNNRCRNQRGYYGVGIEFDLAGANNLVADNEVSDCGDVLAMPTGAPVTTLEATATTEGAGISLRSDINRTTVSGNVCHGNAGHGIAIISSDDCAVSGNILSSNAGSGIYNEGSTGLMLSGNSFNGNAEPFGVASAVDGWTHDLNTAVTVGAAGQRVAGLRGPTGGTSAYGGLLLVVARDSTADAANTAEYLLLVGKHSAGTNITTVSSVGMTAGSFANWPSFTWGIDTTNDELEASPIASTSGTFQFQIHSIGDLTLVA